MTGILIFTIKGVQGLFCKEMPSWHIFFFRWNVFHRHIHSFPLCFMVSWNVVRLPVDSCSLPLLHLCLKTFSSIHAAQTEQLPKASNFILIPSSSSSAPSCSSSHRSLTSWAALHSGTLSLFVFFSIFCLHYCYTAFLNTMTLNISGKRWALFFKSSQRNLTSTAYVWDRFIFFLLLIEIVTTLAMSPRICHLNYIATYFQDTNLIMDYILKLVNIILPPLSSVVRPMVSLKHI